jgi:TatA/E family protein of Tat protein translocase
MFNLGMGEITVILILILIFVGPKKLPEMASGLGRAIRQLRKTTADVKNEIVMDDTFRKPFEELRDAVTLSPEELKRRDQIRQSLEDVRRQAEEVERAANAPLDVGGGEGGDGGGGPATPPPEPIVAESSAPWPPPVAPPPPIAPPVGTFPRSPTPFPRSPTPSPLQPGRLGGPQRVTPPISSLSGDRANITQVLSEEDLLPPSSSSKAPPPLPPPLPGVAPPPGTKKS